MNRVTPESQEDSKSAGESESQPEVRVTAKGRQRWASRTTFILAAIGSAIGLGNFWRFPYLAYKHGGVIFFVPYFIGLFLIGIPMLLLELSLGQKFQRGDIGVFKGINPRILGAGLTSVFSAFIIVTYYTVILAWSAYYLISSFESPLPWSEKGSSNHCSTSAASEFFYIELLKYQDKDTCEFGDPEEINAVNWFVFLAVIASWIIIYLCVFRGVQSSSFVVWVTVPLPIIALLILLVRGVTLEGAGLGIKLYLTGEEGTNYNDVLVGSEIWSDAWGQVFFSLGVAMGVMTSYGSYNPRDKPVIADNFIISLCNSFISFISGFTVFSIIGYLRHTNNPVSSNVSSFGLAYIALPTAATEMPGANFWNVLLYVTIYLLGIDSAFSLVEAISTVLHDTPTGRKFNRMLIALAVWAIGCLGSLVFWTDIGFVLLDVVDHYLTTYVMLGIGILQCFVVGWVYEFKDIRAKVPLKSLLTYNICFWFLIIVFPVVALFSYHSQAWTTLIIIPIVHVGIMFLSWKLAGNMTFKDWFNTVFLAGPRKIARHMTLLSNKGRRDAHQKAKWETVFEVWWGFSIKYFMPTALSFVMFNTFRSDVLERYGDYPLSTNFIGWSIVIFSIILFIIPIFICTKVEPFDIDVDQPFEEMNKNYFENHQKNKQLDVEREVSHEEAEQEEEPEENNAINQSAQVENSSKSIMRQHPSEQVGEQ